MFDVHKENTEYENQIIKDFYVYSQSDGKLLTLSFFNDDNHIDIDFFMGMSGNWCYIPTSEWKNVKFTRFRIDSYDNMSLILHGGYLGPKYKIGGFDTKRGPDPIKEFDKFKLNILNNLDKKVFQLPIYEALLNQEYFSGVGAYLAAEILGRLDVNPFIKFSDLSKNDIEKLCIMINKCINDSYLHGGGELKDWKNPFNKNDIKNWLLYYNNKNICYKQKFGSRNIWIIKKFLPKKNNIF